MKTPFCIALALSLSFVACGKKDAPEPAADSSSGNPLTAPTDYLGAVGKAKKTAEGTVALTSINQAIQMFASEEGRYPKDLNELVTKEYIPSLPKAPYQMKFSYTPATGQVKLVNQ